MLGYIVRRLLLMVPTLLGVLAVVFFIMAFSPGGFGGREMGAEGQVTEGQDARRLRKQMERRYGNNLPKVVQFGRWLNQVSPVGFTMSGDIVFDDSTLAEVRAALADMPLNTHPQSLDRAVGVTLNIAAYRNENPRDVAAMLRTQLADPVEAMSLFAKFDVKLDEYVARRLKERLKTLSLREGGLPRAQNELLDELAFEISGVSRVRFDQPGFKWPDLGTSLKGRRVSALLAERVPVTMLLNVITLPIIYTIAIFSGVTAARRRGASFDVGIGLTFVALWSVPVMWTGVMLMEYFANVRYFHIFPAVGLHSMRADEMPFLPMWTQSGFTPGWLLDMIWHLILPVFCLTYGGLAVMTKVMRGAVLDNLASDYIRTARAKGVPANQVLWRHVLANSLLPLITMASGLIPSLFVGAVVVESIFSINGMGKLSIEAAFAKDREVVMATTLIAAMLGLGAEILRDVCYAIADPRVSYE